LPPIEFDLSQSPLIFFLLLTASQANFPRHSNDGTVENRLSRIDLAQTEETELAYPTKNNCLRREPMSTAGLEGLIHTVELTHIWINDLDERLGWNNKPRSYRLLKAVLHALRDWLQTNEAADFAAQLPGLVRGAYYEQWRPATTPVKKRSKADFIARVEQSFKSDPIANPSHAIMAVFNLLSEKITTGEIEDVCHALPEELRNLWPDPQVARSAVR
jgi:uncharacterized protein (DUF2267 family)